MTVDIRPTDIPTSKLRTQFLRNLPMSSKGTYHTNPLSTLISVIALNRIIETASLTMPSPKTTLNSLGNLSESSKVRDATESVAQIVAEYKSICRSVNLTIRSSSYTEARPFNLKMIEPISLTAMVSENTSRKLTSVLVNPKTRIYLKFCRKRFFFRL